MEYTAGAPVLDGWTIVRPLGEGAFGQVFEIQKDISGTGLKARSALKVMRVPQSPSDVRSAMGEGMDQRSVTSYFRGFVQEIVSEIAIMSTVKSHPNIVSYEDHHIYEYPHEIRWDILIRMELLTPFLNYRRDHAPTELETARLGRDLCAALSYCESKGLIHRDIKPENIFYSDTGQFKLGDFGVARTLEKTSGGLSKKGTESYMAPELYLGQPYGPNVDIYSLGLVLYRELNGGRLPFFPPAPETITFSSRENALSRRMKGEPVPPPAFASPAMAEIVRRACAYRPQDRYRSAAEMLGDLERFLNGGTSGVTGAVRKTAVPQNAVRDVPDRTFGAFQTTVTDTGGGAVSGGTFGAFGSPPAGQGTFGSFEGPFSGTYGGPVRTNASEISRARAESMRRFWSGRLEAIATRAVPNYTGKLAVDELYTVVERIKTNLSIRATSLGMSQEEYRELLDLDQNGVIGILGSFGVMNFRSRRIKYATNAMVVSEKALYINLPGPGGFLAVRYQDIRDAKAERNSGAGEHFTLKILTRSGNVRSCTDAAGGTLYPLLNLDKLAAVLMELIR